MPRKSAASLTVVAGGLAERLAPPPHLSVEQRRLWLEVVNSKPVEWFGKDSGPILLEYVRAVETCGLLAEPVRAAMEDGDPGDIEKILKVRDREAKRAADLATKLRLTQQSRYTPQAAATANRNHNAAKPWQTNADKG